ncbi:DUF608 domain-containing protein [Balamuthia mandrillaris]
MKVPKVRGDALACLCFVLACCCSVASCITAPSAAALGFVCAPTNDVFALLSSDQSPRVAVQRYDTVDEAINNAASNSGLLLLADSYPRFQVNVTSDQLTMAAKKNLRLFIEFPSSLPGLAFSAPQSPSYFRRVIAASNALTQWKVRRLDILMAQDAYYTQLPADVSAQVAARSLLVFAKVAGVRNATFGLPDVAEQVPVLFTQASNSSNAPSVLVATTKLSQLVTGRYTPHEAWRGIWSYILTQMAASPMILPDYEPILHPSFGPTEALPANASLSAFQRATDWLAFHSNLLSIGDNNSCPAPFYKAQPAASPLICMLEGYSSYINWNSTQQYATAIRMDCNAESAMALAAREMLSPALPSNKQSSSFGSFAAGILDYVYFYSLGQQAQRNNPSDSQYGLLAWGVSSPAWLATYYGDDNARVMLATAAAISSLQTTAYQSMRWHEPLLRALFANLRTTGAVGFRPGSITVSSLESQGWKAFFTSKAGYSETPAPQPHYQAYLWASFLWAYNRTGVTIFLDRARNGIMDSMKYYPAQWRWTEYLSEEQARFLLPLAWLVRVDNSSDNRQLLRKVASDYLAAQTPQAYGAIEERLGTPGYCDMCPPSSNAAYGSGENPLIQTDADPVVDTLYSQNFALLALIEAYGATHDPFYGEAAAKLAEFIVRCQAASKKLPYLDGAWLRAMDYSLWDFWGSNADPGWGPWSVETGWTEGWLASALAFQHMNTSLWDITTGSGPKQVVFPKEMVQKVCSDMQLTAFC